MAVDFGMANASRYYTTPDDASFTMPDGDWTIISVAQSDTGDYNGQYLLSTGNDNGKRQRRVTGIRIWKRVLG